MELRADCFSKAIYLLCFCPEATYGGFLWFLTRHVERPGARQAQDSGIFPPGLPMWRECTDCSGEAEDGKNARLSSTGVT